MATCLDNLPQPTLALSQKPIYIYIYIHIHLQVYKYIRGTNQKANQNQHTHPHPQYPNKLKSAAKISLNPMPLSPSSMASIPQLYSNYTFTATDLADFPLAHALNGNINTSVMDNIAMWGGQDSFINNPVLDNGALDHVVSLDCDTMNSANWIPSFAEQVRGVSDLAVPTLSDCKMGLYGGITGFQNFSSRYQQRIGDFGEECCGFVEDVKPPAYANAARENWVCMLKIEIHSCVFH